ncbi:MAG: 6-carboxyhexanoate--CoA ligase [Nitrospirae bacterium]|nr:6-carboxyhexanoate--CoA ligase [Nitrospirota bacterium]
MRASKTVRRKTLSVKSRKTKDTEIHISGAEGLYEFSEIERITKNYFLRAMSHPKGMPDKVVITIEKIKQKPIIIPLLPVSTFQCNSPDEARKGMHKLLSGVGISKKAIQNGIRVVTFGTTMHGAALILNESGIRVEPDKRRGVRVSRLGIRKDSEKILSRRLRKEGINTTTVKEAIILASKVASCKGVVAELCISDDPDYTTGYVASKGLGYVRIPHIKQKGSPSGGRVFFIKERADVKRVIEYLERRPVIAGD